MGKADRPGRGRDRQKHRDTGEGKGPVGEAGLILTKNNLEVWEAIEHFLPVELGGYDRLGCPCCGLLELDLHAMRLHSAARVSAGIPFNVTEGGACRCPSYQTSLIKAGLTKVTPDRSAHCPKDGKGSSALDISIRDGLGGPVSSRNRYKIIRGYFYEGVERIGLYSTFVHADWDDELPKQVAW